MCLCENVCVCVCVCIYIYKPGSLQVFLSPFFLFTREIAQSKREGENKNKRNEKKEEKKNRIIKPLYPVLPLVVLWNNVVVESRE